MSKVYITLRKSNEPKLPYLSKVNGDEGLHYDSESLLLSLAHRIINQYSKARIILRNNLPLDEKKLRGTIDTLVRGHNICVLLGSQGDINGRREARKMLEDG
ncbi:hypothetical protein GOV12_03810 [Candidatus Pacearchaeota archaeon]|nr:hypothetical protein [Candidatus Pacearchaeota archaeon]